MFGKSVYEVKTNIGHDELFRILDKWCIDNKLTDISKTTNYKKFRFGSPIISNPIYIEVFFENSTINIHGWVQTMIPFIRWNLIEAPKESLSTKLDYRRKGGLFVSRLRNLIGKKN